MTDPDERPGVEALDAGSPSSWRRRRRLAAVFGSVLPETTADERGAGEPHSNDERLRSEVPPHHD